jgi:hypothetical protein
VLNATVVLVIFSFLIGLILTNRVTEELRQASDALARAHEAA